MRAGSHRRSTGPGRVLGVNFDGEIRVFSTDASNELRPGSTGR